MISTCWPYIIRRLSGDRSPALRLTREVTDAIRSYPFPGNIRELENALTHAAALASKGQITLDCLPEHIAEAARAMKGEDTTAGSYDIIADWPTMEGCAAALFAVDARAQRR